MRFRMLNKNLKVTILCFSAIFLIIISPVLRHPRRYFKTFRDPPLLFYNKVPKCASSSLLSVANTLKFDNGFYVYQHQLGTIPMSKRPPRENISKEVDIVSNLKTPAFYARHVYFIDFRQYGDVQPVYINMVRDPIERFVSHFYFRQVGSYHSNKSYSRIDNVNDCILNNDTRCDREYDKNFIMRYFCGQDRICFGTSEEAVRLAKDHIDEHFLFIGIVEEFDNTLRILEKVLPDYFHGALDAWRKIRGSRMHDYATIVKHELLPEARKLLKKKLHVDYEIYHYVKREFDFRKQSYGFV